MNVNLLVLSDFLAFCANREFERNFWNTVFCVDGTAFAFDHAAEAARDTAVSHGVVVDLAIFDCAISKMLYEANVDLLNARRRKKLLFLQTYIEGLRKAMRLARTFASSYIVRGCEDED